MKRKGLWKVAVIFLATVLVVSSFVFFLPASKKTIGNHGNGNAFSLIKPAFLSEAIAADDGTNFLKQEAGISVYTNSGQTIDINSVSSAFRTIEYQTSDYIIGSVALPNYPETEDVHAYVHTSGWIVVYYLKEEPAAKIVDWYNYGTDEKIKGTKLEDGLSVICSAAGVPVGSPKYYDFKYPNANKLMIVVDALWSGGNDTFNIKLPGAFTFYEYSYSHCNKSGGDSSDMYIDENKVDTVGAGGTHYGLLSAAQLSPDVFHTVTVTPASDTFGYRSYPTFDAIVLIYGE